MTDSYPIIANNAFYAVLDTMRANDSKGESWLIVPAKEHLRHAATHLSSYKAGDASEDHLGHAMTRIAMAMEIGKAMTERSER